MEIRLSEDSVLRLVSRSDAQSCFATIEESRDFLLRHESSIGSIGTLEQAEELLLRSESLAAAHAGYGFALWKEDRFAGLFAVHQVDPKHKKASLGYWLGERYTGQGLATRALQTLVDFCFSELALNRLEATTAISNRSSIALLRRLGFQREGLLRGSYLVRGRFVDDYLFSLLSSDREHSGSPALIASSPFSIRRTQQGDVVELTSLYQMVARTPGGIARAPSEISVDCIRKSLDAALSRGLALIAHEPGSGKLVGSIHASRPEPMVFSHVLGDLTIIIHPDYQERGLGRALFGRFLDLVRSEFPDIRRVELVARESNRRAIALYEKLGFRREGCFEDRIASVCGGFEADIPMAWLRPKV